MTHWLKAVVRYSYVRTKSSYKATVLSVRIRPDHYKTPNVRAYGGGWYMLRQADYIREWERYYKNEEVQARKKD